MTFWDHLDVLRSSLIRMGVAVVVFAIAAFLMKETLFSVVLAPRSSDFVTYRLLGVAAFSWGHVLPINKSLWSSTFVLAAGSYSVAMLALFYWITDVMGWKRGMFFFEVVGLNSITIYMAQKLIDFDRANKFLFGGVASLFPDKASGVVLAVGYIAVVWLFLYFLHRQKVYLKV